MPRAVSVRDLIEGYDYNASLIQDLSVTFSYTYTPCVEYEDYVRKAFLQNKDELWYLVEQGFPPFLAPDGNPMDPDSVTEQMLWDRFWPMHRTQPIRTHRYIEKGPALRVWEVGSLLDDGTYVTEDRTSFDGVRYAFISPLSKQGSVIGAYDFHAVDEPRKFLPTVNYRHWPDFARPGATRGGPKLVVRLPDGTTRPQPIPPVELKVAGVEVVDDREVYKVTHTSFPNNFPDLFPGGLARTVHSIYIDPERGYQVTRWVSERALRRTVEEQFVVTERTLADQIQYASDAAGEAWFITHARIRRFTSDVRAYWKDWDWGEEVDGWPPKLILVDTAELITHDIRINTGMSDQAFRIEFPSGYLLFNDITGTARVVGAAPADQAIRDAAELLQEAVGEVAAPPSYPCKAK